METNIGRIWLALLVLALAVVVFFAGDSLKPIGTKEGEAPFLTALTQLGILYVVALFVERSLEVLIKAWRQGGKSRLQEEVRSAEEGAKAEAEKALEEYKAGTQRRALLVGLTLGILVSVSGVRLLGPIFEFGVESAWSFQQAIFQFTDIIVTAGLIAGGSADNPRADGAGRRVPEKEPNARKPILKSATFRQRANDGRDSRKLRQEDPNRASTWKSNSTPTASERGSFLYTSRSPPSYCS